MRFTLRRSFRIGANVAEYRWVIFRERLSEAAQALVGLLIIAAIILFIAKAPFVQGLTNILNGLIEAGLYALVAWFVWLAIFEWFLPWLIVYVWSERPWHEAVKDAVTDFAKRLVAPVAIVCAVLGLIRGWSEATLTRTIADVVGNPSEYDDVGIDVTGTIRDLRYEDSRSGQPYAIFDLCDRRCVRVYSEGDRTDFYNGDGAEVWGKYHIENRVGRYVFRNEIVADSVQTEEQAEQEYENSQH